MGILNKVLDFIIEVDKPTEHVVSEAVRPIKEFNRSNYAYGLSSQAPFDGYATPAYNTVAIGSFQLWFENPIARRIIEIMRDFILGDGFEIKAKNPDVQEWVDEWSNDPEVDLHDISERYVTDLLVLGELILKPDVNQISGFTRYEPLDPTRVSTVYTRFGKPWLISGYSMGYDGYYYGGAGMTSHAGLLKVVTLEKDPRSAEQGMLVGDILMSQITASTMLSRGYSVLSSLRDWLEAYDEFLFSEIARAIALRKFLVDLEIEGADEATIEEYRKKYADPPESGTVIIHNELEKWDFKSPDLKSAEAETLGKTILHQILAGGGIAEHWLASGGDVNRATAKEMATPILRRLTRYQAIFFRFIEQVVEYARDRAIAAGAIPGVNIDSEGIDIKIIPDLIDIIDEQAQWEMANNMVNSLVNAVSAGFMTDSEARDASVKFLRAVGISAKDMDKVSEDKLIKLYESEGRKYTSKFRDLREKRKGKH